MEYELNRINDTQVELTIKADKVKLKATKQIVLKKLQPEVSAQGFRKGKVPLNIVEKQVEPSHLEREFLDLAMTEAYREALEKDNLRPVSNPEVTVTKFVPYTELEFKVSIEVVPPIKVADYKKIKKSLPKIELTEKEIDAVIENIRTRLAEKKTVDRKAKQGDEVLIDFVGFDDKQEKLQGGSGTDYPLNIGSNTFIPGFEENITDLSSGDDKTFDVTFPADYHSKLLAGKKASFTVNVKEVKEVVLPEVNDDLATKSGPFKTMTELRADIVTQLSKQKSQEADQVLKNEILEELASKSKLELPSALVESQIEAIKNEQQQNLVYRGLTWDEYLAQSGETEEEYMQKILRPDAENRVRIGLVLSELSKIEGIEVTPEELEVRLQVIRSQSQDPQTLTQLEDPDVRRDISSQLLSDKTVNFLFEQIVK